MYAALSGLVAVVFYSLGSFYQSQNLASARNNRRRVLTCGILAVVTHLLNVYWVIRVPGGYDFDFFNMATLFSWTIAVIVLLSSLKKPLENLFLALFPLAVVSIVLSTLLDSDITPNTYSGGELAHILLALLATSTITIAAVQAGFLAFQNHQLKHHVHAFRVLRRLPPLQTMEALLFEILWVGLVLLSAVILTGFLFMEDVWAQHLAHKTALSLVAWVVFAVLLSGRHFLGWRGNTAIRWTLTGFAFLVLAYFGSKFVLELVLHRA